MRKHHRPPRRRLRLSVFLGVLAILGASIAASAVPASATTNPNPQSFSYPWAAANYVDANYDWGYSTCPSNDTGCMTFSGYNGGVLYGEADPWGYYLRNCTSFVASELTSLGVPAGDVEGLGNGGSWYSNAPSKHLSRGTTPQVGAAVVQEPSSSHADGHVAYVTKYSGSTITIEEFNYYGDGTGDTRTGTAAALGFNNEYVYFASLMTSPPGSSGSSGSSNYQPFTGDFNGDGIGDIGLRDVSDGNFFIKHGPSFGDQVVYSWAAGSNYQAFAGDFNGDGIWDIGLRNTANGNIYIKHGPTFGDQIVYTWAAGTNYQVFAGDFNGDGIWDIGLRDSDDGNFFIKHGPSFGDQVVYTWASGTNYQPFTGDFNGDGIGDIGLRNVSNGNFFLKHGPTFSDQVVYTWAAG
jgi:surface antigen